jgi:hypothetical protein
MAETKMCFRTDGSHFDHDKPDNRPKPKPGDTWRIFWYHKVNGIQVNDRIAGYAICCPKCGRIHSWTSAADCSGRVEKGICEHQLNRTSCWTWTGSAEDNQLSATPSLHCVEDRGGCGWHGNLTNGVLIGA